MSAKKKPMVKEKNKLTQLESGSLQPERIQQIWERRAQLLAQEEVAEEIGEKIDIVLVALGDELLGLEVQYVADIRLQEQVVRVPRTPEWVAGVVNQRGRIYSVLDMGLFLGLPPSNRIGESLFVTVQTPAIQVIFAVDDVPGVEVLQFYEALANDSGVHRLPTGYVRAVIEHRGSSSRQPFITLLDMDAMLSDPRLIVDEEFV